MTPSHYHTIGRFDSEQVATEHAMRLVEQGIGAAPAALTDADADAGDGPAAAFGVQVLAEDTERACEVLGLPLPEGHEPWEKPRPPYRLLAILWLVAFVTIPLLAFYLTSQLGD